MQFHLEGYVAPRIFDGSVFYPGARRKHKIFEEVEKADSMLNMVSSIIERQESENITTRGIGSDGDTDDNNKSDK